MTEDQIRDLMDRLCGPKSPLGQMRAFDQKLELRWLQLYVAALILTPIAIILGWYLS